MAINVSFNGATIYKPGAYSKTEIDLSGGFPLSPTGIVAIFGESETGTPGAEEVNIANNVFTPDEMPMIQAKYGSGNIVDACNFLFAPGADGAIPGGAQSVYIYKTNAATQASFAGLAPSYGTITADMYGTAGNLITFSNTIVPETEAVETGSAVIAPSAVNTGQGQTLIIATNGAAPVTYTIAASASTSVLLGLLNAAFPTLTFTQNVANNIVITQNPDAGTPWENGWGDSFEIMAASSSLSTFGFVAGLYTPAQEEQAILVNNNTGTLVVETGTVGGNVVLALGFKAAANDATAATVSISATAMTLTVTGGAQAGTSTFSLAAYSAISQLVNAINILPKVSGSGWSCSVPTTLNGQLPVSSLDRVTNVGALSSSGAQPARIKDDAFQVANFFAQSSLVTLTPGTGSFVGLPSPQTEVALTGGTLGGTSTASIVNALTQFQGIRVNSVIPLFSRDATADIADGLTDPSSNYTIAGINQAVKTHCSLMATTKQRSERQGYLSYKNTYANCKTESGIIADAREQLFIQDINNINSLGVIQWFQPWAGACMVAGARGGSPIGLPMTFKYFNCSGIRQTGQPMSTPEADIVIDFNPAIQYDDAIQANITFFEAPQTGGFRLVVDNTTYGVDDNWVFNRANVLYAADVLAYDFRNQLENIYVGKKNTVNVAEIKSTASSILNTYLAQGITVSTTDAPNGFKQLVVQLNGNTINISVVVKLVEGIDFILADITLQRATAAS